MRGHWLLCGLLLAAVMLPAAASAREAQDVDAPRVEWLAPSQGYAQHPVHAAIAVSDGGPVPHQSFIITITLDDEQLVHTESVHEHDGFHTVVLTPPRSGTLRLHAQLGAGDTGSAPTATATVPIARSPDSDRVPYEPFRVEPRFERPSDDTLSVWGRHHGIEHQTLIDVQDADGRLLVSQWPLPGGAHVSHVAQPIGGYGTGLAHALVTSHPQDELTVFTETRTQRLDQPHQTIARLPSIYLGEDDCDDLDVPLILDPNPVLDNGRTWHTDTDVRLAIATGEHLDGGYRSTESGRLAPTSAFYHLMGHDPAAQTTGTQGNWMRATAADPFRELTFRVRDPGMYVLSFADMPKAGAERDCTLYFQIVPNTDSAPGILDHLITVRNDTARVHFLALRDGAALPHYEFDTRVIKLHTDDAPGRLVWKGKLHGHNGYAMFELGGLDPGTYEVRTYPSPQDLGTPPVAAPSEEGFAYRFTVEGPPPVQAESTDPEPRATPMAAPLLVVLVLLGFISLTARRRK